MSVQRFVGPNSRDAMRQVREALGDDALILANRPTEGGIEILAMADNAVAALDTPVPARSPAPPTDAAPWQAMSERLLREMQEMRELLDRRAPPKQSATPSVRERLMAQLLAVGFSREIATEVLDGLPARLEGNAKIGGEATQAWLGERLAARLATLESEAALLDRPGIVALVGPTGVGKTTTTAKLAARFVMRHGAASGALVTTDSFRIGAHEQLRIYARLLDVPMFALEADAPLDTLSERLQSATWVMVDTVGTSQRDQRVITQMAALKQTPVPVRLVLVLNAASQPDILEEVIERYRQAARAAGATLDDCIITKQDEAGRLGPLLDVVMRHDLRLLFGAHGQQVPEDLALIDSSALVAQALATARPDAPVHVPAASPSRDILGQGRRVASLLERLRHRVTGFSQLEQLAALSGLPRSVQAARLETLLATLPVAEVLGICWSPRRRERGMDWALPDLGVDAEGRWTALAWPQHRQPAGWAARLEAQTTATQAAVHWLPAGLDAEAHAWLEAQLAPWVGAARASQRVVFQGERLTLGQLFAASQLGNALPLRFQGRALEQRSAYAEVTLAGFATPLLAWCLDLFDPESERVQARRYYVTPARLGSEALALLTTPLQAEGVAALTRRAWQLQKKYAEGDIDVELRLLLASGMAAAVMHLDVASDDGASTLRRDLLALVGRRQRRDTALLDALHHAFMTREAIRALSASYAEADE